MAEFAQLNADNIVECVLVVSDTVIGEGSYSDQEKRGSEFLRSVLGAEDVYVRGERAATGMFYDRSSGEFRYAE